MGPVAPLALKYFPRGMHMNGSLRLAFGYLRLFLIFGSWIFGLGSVKTGFQVAVAGQAQIRIIGQQQLIEPSFVGTVAISALAFSDWSMTTYNPDGFFTWIGPMTGVT